MTRELNLSKCALLIIDMQNQFAPIAEHLVPRLVALGDRFLKAERPVFLTLHHDKPEETSELIRFWGGDVRIERGGNMWDLIAGMKVLKDRGSKIIDEKTAYDSFYKTDLEEQLRELGVEQVVITGTLTNLCCETTARSAFVGNFQVFFVDDLNAAAERNHHEATIRNLEYGFATIVNEEQVLDIFL